MHENIFFCFFKYIYIHTHTHTHDISLKTGYLNTIFVFLQHQNTDLKINTSDSVEQTRGMREFPHVCMLSYCSSEL